MRQTTPLFHSPQQGLWQRILIWTVPLASLGSALVLGAVPLAPAAWALVVPDFVAPTLFFWAVHQPRQLPLVFVFLGGIAADMMHQTPLGVHAAAYMVITLLGKTQAATLAGLGLLFNWAIFALAMVAFGVTKLLASVVGTTGVLQALLPAVLQTIQLVLTTIVAYLAFHFVFSALHRWIGGRDRL